MKKRLIVVGLFGVVVGSCFCLMGCKQEKIQFYRESAASNLMNKLNANQSSKPNKAKGVIILKDESYQTDNIRFGPSDINFDIK